MFLRGSKIWLGLRIREKILLYKKIREFPHFLDFQTKSWFRNPPVFGKNHKRILLISTIVPKRLFLGKRKVGTPIVPRKHSLRF
ncbi:hypothetical protein CH380_06020 [Leptospira adleri]|uniref:Uncharacterized protein n=1 Tax=Leptospira adleri TaxID=2023186 RepID=A0A2M9YRB3_9LEPT|nr:hypothetical protein CH380_06020 [Leptospira adleri]PJZ61091.1 hypothetical protein CH376_15055 [Leptospira adleri]